MSSSVSLPPPCHKEKTSVTGVNKLLRKDNFFKFYGEEDIIDLCSSNSDVECGASLSSSSSSLSLSSPFSLAETSRKRGREEGDNEGDRSVVLLLSSDDEDGRKDLNKDDLDFGADAGPTKAILSKSQKNMGGNNINMIVTSPFRKSCVNAAGQGKGIINPYAVVSAGSASPCEPQRSKDDAGLGPDPGTPIEPVIAKGNGDNNSNMIQTTSFQNAGRQGRKIINPYAVVRAVCASPGERQRSKDDVDIGAAGTPTESILVNTKVSSDGNNSNMIQTPPLPVFNRIGEKQYPDRRHCFIRALTRHAMKSRRTASHRFIFEAALRAMVVLSLRDHAVRTWDACRCIKGIGKELMSVFKDAESTGKEDGVSSKKPPYKPPRGKFSAAAPAVLVALLQNEKDNGVICEAGGRGDNVDDGDRKLCSMETLIERVNRMVDFPPGTCLDKPMHYYLDRKNLDAQWGQVKKLCVENIHAGFVPFIKERRKKAMSMSGVAFELLPEGRSVARRLLRSLCDGTHVSGPGPLRQFSAHFVEKEYAKVTMCVDFREGGGRTRRLHDMCDALDDHGVPYVVRNLQISDYVFFVGNRLAPILIERKSVDDVANSLADGRWERQQRNMRKAQYVLGGGSERRCQICYLIEGEASRRIVHGGNVGRNSWNKSVEDVEKAIAKLPKLGFSVIQSKTMLGSMVILSRVARDVSWKAHNGSTDILYTYEEFLDRCKSCDEREGDPPQQACHMNPAPPVVDPRDHLASPPIPESHCTKEVQDEKQRKLEGFSMAKLKGLCKERDEMVSGKKKDLVTRLLKQRKPEVLITRRRLGQFVPKLPSCNAALMVALYLNNAKDAVSGLTKEKLMICAEETGVSKDPMSGNGGWYDGWSGMKDLLNGDPALVCMSKKRYSLTANPPGSAGVDVARALHVLAHRESLCRCGNEEL